MEVVWRGTKGDLFIHIEIDIPVKISKEQRELYEKLMELSGGKKSDKGFFSHLFN
jgi:DnaJ-class molecular chaperone